MHIISPYLYNNWYFSAKQRMMQHYLELGYSHMSCGRCQTEYVLASLLKINIGIARIFFLKNWLLITKPGSLLPLSAKNSLFLNWNPYEIKHWHHTLEVSPNIFREHSDLRLHFCVTTFSWISCHCIQGYDRVTIPTWAKSRIPDICI